MPVSPLVDRAVGVVAIVALVVGSVVIGVQRASLDRFLYISEMGAVGLPTEEPFRFGFGCVAVGIGLVAWVVRDVRSRARLLSAWPPALSLAASAACFAVASQVNCSEGCPVLLAEGMQLRDLIHISFAVLGFVAGCFAMLQFASARDAWMRRLSVVGGILIGVIAAIGGVISLVRGNTDVGSTMEFVAAAIGVAWLIVVTVLDLMPARPTPAAEARELPFTNRFRVKNGS